MEVPCGNSARKEARETGPCNFSIQVPRQAPNCLGLRATAKAQLVCRERCIQVTPGKIFNADFLRTRYWVCRGSVTCLRSELNKVTL